MGYLDFSNDEIMSRKEYLKSKKKAKLPYIKYTLLVIVIILLSIYVTKQIKTYNTVTTVAKSVMEETSLLKTLNIYYMNDGYTKDSKDILTRYISQNESRKSYNDTETMKDIFYKDEYIYGIKDNNLYRIKVISSETEDKSSIELIVKDNVIGYTIYENYIYVVKYKESDDKINGLYKININNAFNDENIKKILSGVIYQVVVDKDSIYTVSPAKTIRSLVKYNKLGKEKTILTTDEIISYLSDGSSTLIFTNQNKNGSISVYNKANKKFTNLPDDIQGKYIKNGLSDKIDGNKYIRMYGNNIIYLSSKDSTIYSYNTVSKENIKLFEEKVNKFELVDDYIYYKDNKSLKLMEYNIKDKVLKHITSIRGNEFVCVR